jgi:hypothetical protein
MSVIHFEMPKNKSFIFDLHQRWSPRAPQASCVRAAHPRTLTGVLDFSSSPFYFYRIIYMKLYIYDSL